MNRTIKISLLVVVIAAMAYLANQISYFARDGELKLHLTHGMMEARKKIRLLPLRTDKGLRQICKDHAATMAQQGHVIDELADVSQSLKNAGSDSEAFYVEVGLMKPPRTYMMTPESLREASLNPSYTHRGYGQKITPEGTYFCYILAGKAPRQL